MELYFLALCVFLFILWIIYLAQKNNNKPKIIEKTEKIYIEVEKPKPPKKTKAEFYQEQQVLVKEGGYDYQPLLNYTERTARQGIYQALKETNQLSTHLLFAQASLGEILVHKDYKKYRAINSKRVDFVLCDKKTFTPKILIEIHGTGHNGKYSYQRDQIKEDAITSAGLIYLGIKVGLDEQEIKNTVCDAVSKHIID